MTTLNELIPNTADTGPHQGRLHHVPSNLLPKTIVGAIFEEAQESSLVLRLGKQIPVSYGETVIPITTKRPAVGQVGNGTSNEQREGGRKPLSGTAWDTSSFSPIKLATIVTVSEEFSRTNPAGLYTQIQSDLAFAIGRGVDLAVFHGKDALLGTNLVGINTDNVIANTANYKNLVAGEISEGLLEGYDMVNADSRFEFNGWAVDPRFRSTLARNLVFKDNNGNIDASRINLAAGVQDIMGLPAQFGRAVGGDLDAATDSGIRLIGGDFNQLRWGFADQIRVKISDTASLTDGTSTVSMFQTNQIAVLIECTFGWVLGDKEGFVKFANTGVATYDVVATGDGTFKLEVDGVETAAVAEDVSAANLKTAIVAVDDSILAADVTVTGSAGTYEVTLPALLEAGAVTGATTVTVTAA